MVSLHTPCLHSVASVFLKGFWQTEGSPDYQVEYILPKGDVELIFSFDDSADFCREGVGSGNTPRCFINGISNLPVRLLVPRQQFFFGVILHAAAVKKLLTAPSGNFLNAITDLELVDQSFTDIWHELAACNSFKERVSFMEQWVIGKQPHLYPQERELSNFLTSTEEVTDVAQLAAHFCYSSRQLHRKVQELYGMSSEVLLRFKRYQHAIKLMHHSSETLTRVAYACGYYDQSHFNREFKEYTGMPPGDYRKKKSHLPGHLYQ